MALLTNDFEGQTNGASATNTNSANSGVALAFNRTNSSTTTYSSAHPAHGSMGLLMASTSAGACSATVNLSAATSSAASRRYLYTDALPSATTQIMQINGVVVYLNSNGTIELHDKSSTTIWTSTGTLSAGTQYRLEMALATGTGTGDGTVKFSAYVGDAGTAISGLSYSSTTMNAGTGTFTQAVFGRSSAGSAGAWNDWIDDLAAVNGTTTFIGPPSSPPTAAFTFSSAGLTASFDGTSSAPVSPATIAGYAWDFGDSTGTSTSSTPTYTYTTAGTYTVSLTVTDSNSLTGSVSHSVTITAPQASVTVASITLSTGWTASTGTALACITDGDPTTFITSSASPTGLELDLKMQAMTPPITGQSLVVVLGSDMLLATSGTVDAQLYEGATLRSSLTNQAITAGSGSSVAGTVILTFPWSDVSSVSSWDALTVKLQVTAS